jgi:hypothetical protein
MAEDINDPDKSDLPRVIKFAYDNFETNVAKATTIVPSVNFSMKVKTKQLQ